jgi:hypothetical protein
MIAAAGGLGCAFNATVYEDTLRHVLDVLEWAQRNIDIVHTVVFITFRTGVLGGGFDYYVGGQPVDFSQVPYATSDRTPHELQSTDVVAEIQQRFPDFAPAAYLNGTERPDSFKWLLAGHLGTRERIYGYVGPRARRPSRVREPLRFQSVMIIQPIDVYEDGAQNMCDACPDVTVWNDRLVWSCRLEEPGRLGDFVQMVPRETVPAEEPVSAQATAPRRNGNSQSASAAAQNIDP